MKDKKIYILLVVSILIAVLGISYAFFSLNVIGNDTAKNNRIVTGSLELTFDDSDEIYLNNIIPSDYIKKLIRITNTGTREVSYDIGWDNYNNDIINDELVIEGYCNSFNIDGKSEGDCSDFSQRAINGTNILSNIPIEPGITHEYGLVITFIDTKKPQNYNKNKGFKGNLNIVESKAQTVFCTFDGDLKQGAEYVNGQYTYRYMQEGDYSGDGLGWKNITDDGWGVQLTNKTSTDAVSGKLCTYINNKPVVSMAQMFLDSKATSIDVSSFNTSKVKSMQLMFCNLSTNSLNLNSFNTSNVTNMTGMFSSYNTDMLDLNSFNTGKVTNMGGMFNGAIIKELKLDNFNTENVIDMGGMFSDSSINKFNLNNFDTGSVTNMYYMFANFNNNDCYDIDLDLSNFNTSNVTNMEMMFMNSVINTLDLSSFNTSNVINMNYMFNGLDSLKVIYTSNKFVVDNVTDSNNMFGSNLELSGGRGTAYDNSKIDKTYARIDGGLNSPGYFTDSTKKASLFTTDTWDVVIKSIKSGNTRNYKVGDFKTIYLGSEFGTHTVRVANISTPSECNKTGFSQSACGFVLEFADIVTGDVMYNSDYSEGGWPGSYAYYNLNTTLYNAFPSLIKNAIIDTTVVSSRDPSDSSDYVSTDKLYLLAPTEVWGDVSSFGDNIDTAKNLTRQLDYYKSKNTTINNTSFAIKGYRSISGEWWLRSFAAAKGDGFFAVTSDGEVLGDGLSSGVDSGFSPAFRIA